MIRHITQKGPKICLEILFKNMTKNNKIAEDILSSSYTDNSMTVFYFTM